MRLRKSLLALTTVVASIGSAIAGSVQIGLPGYILDTDPLVQATPQLVLATLRDDPNARIMKASQPGIAVVGLIDTPLIQTAYIFFGKEHWAYPSVLRLRRAQENGVWATRIAYLCGADKPHCKRLEKKLAARESQVSRADVVAMANSEVKRLLQPLPEGTQKPNDDFWISQWGLLPGGSEKSWQREDISPSTSMDPACKVIGPRYARAPQYPIKASIDGIGGTAVVVMTIDGAGQVIDAVFEKSSRNRDLDRAALSAASVMRFYVDDCDKSDSMTRVRIPFSFSPEYDFSYVPMAHFDATEFGY